MKNNIVFLYVSLLVSMPLQGKITQKLTAANDKITTLKKEIKSDKTHFVCQSSWCIRCKSFK